VTEPTKTPRRAVNRAEAQLALFVAGRALGISLDVDQLRAMADLTCTLDDITLAVDLLSGGKAATAKELSPDRLRAIVQALRATGSGGTRKEPS
jgi:hypothetical protein